MREWTDENGTRHWVDDDGREHVELVAVQELHLEIDQHIELTEEGE